MGTVLSWQDKTKQEGLLMTELCTILPQTLPRVLSSAWDRLTLQSKKASVASPSEKLTAVGVEARLVAQERRMSLRSSSRMFSLLVLGLDEYSLGREQESKLIPVKFEVEGGRPLPLLDISESNEDSPESRRLSSSSFCIASVSFPN